RAKVSEGEDTSTLANQLTPRAPTPPRGHRPGRSSDAELTPRSASSAQPSPGRAPGAWPADETFRSAVDRSSPASAPLHRAAESGFDRSDIPAGLPPRQPPGGMSRWRSPGASGSASTIDARRGDNRPDPEVGGIGFTQ